MGLEGRKGMSPVRSKSAYGLLVLKEISTADKKLTYNSMDIKEVDND